MMVEGNRGHHLNVVPYLGKILIRGLRGIKARGGGSRAKKMIFLLVLISHRAISLDSELG